MSKVRLGILGIGGMGSGHCRNLLADPDCELTLAAVCDIKESRRQWAKENLPESVLIFDNADDMIASDAIDAVLVAVPHYDHPKYVIQALQHGKHVMSEKPAGVYTKQVREAIEEAKKHPDLVYGLMFNQRTNHVYRAMHDLVQGGQYGAMKRVNWIITDWFRTQAYYNSGGWRATWSGEGGGVLLNQCPHQLDLLQWICGLPVKVDAHLAFGKWHDIEVEDDVTAFMEFENGATGVFVTTTGSYPGTNRFEVELDRAKVVVENNELYVYELDQPVSEVLANSDQGFARIPGHEVKVETDGKNPQHMGVLAAFAARILRGEPLVAEGPEGIRGLTLSNAMHLSAWLGHAVEIPFDEDLYYDELMKRVATSRVKENVAEVTFNTDGSYGSEKK